MNTITVDSAEFATLPRTIRDLITAAVEIGGEVELVNERRYEFHLPSRMVGGVRKLINRAAVGYYVRDGKNIIGGSHEVRREIAYWGRQSR